MDYKGISSELCACCLWLHWWRDGASLSVGRELPFVLAAAWLIWRPFQSTAHWNTTHSHHCELCLATKDSPVQILFLAVLISITFIPSRSFHCTRLPHHRQMPPNTSHLSLHASSTPSPCPYVLIIERGYYAGYWKRNRNSTTQPLTYKLSYLQNALGQ